MADDAARAERQARLSKALSAAYLSHQIEQLEDRVTSNLTLGNRGRGRARRGRRPQGQGQGQGQRDQREPRKPAVEEPIEETRLVLDTSALLFALSAITRLLRSGRAELIVPLETLRTLDLLKKGMHPYAVAARTATRSVETEQRRTQARKGEGEVGDDGWRKLRPGLWIQRDNEQEHIAERAQAVDPIPSPPPFIQSTLACALYFRNFWDLISSQPVLGVAVPPEIEIPAEDPVARYADRADGRALREWADRGDVFVRLFGERTDDSSEEEAAFKEPEDVPTQDGFLDQEEGRIMTLTSPSDDPRVRQRRQPARAPPPASDRVPKIYDAEKGMVPSTELLAQRERERERDVRGGRRGAPARGKPPMTRPPGSRDAPRKPQNAPPVLLQRARNPVEDREPVQGFQPSRGRRPQGMRGARQEEGQGPKVMLLQRPK